MFVEWFSEFDHLILHSWWYKVWISLTTFHSAVFSVSHVVGHSRLWRKNCSILDNTTVFENASSSLKFEVTSTYVISIQQTYNNSIFSYVYEASNLSSWNHGIFSNEDMITNVKREEGYPKTVNNKHSESGFKENLTLYWIAWTVDGWQSSCL